MSEKISVSWLDKMGFEAEVNNHKITLDATPEVGGLDRGSRPKPLMMVALGGCTAMDVVSILTKMRVDLKDFKVSVEGKLTEEHPKYYKEMNVIYEFWGKDLPLKKLEKAVNLSEERYCGVSVVYKKIMKITSEIIVHNVE